MAVNPGMFAGAKVKHLNISGWQISPSVTSLSAKVFSFYEYPDWIKVTGCSQHTIDLVLGVLTDYYQEGDYLLRAENPVTDILSNVLQDANSDIIEHKE